MVDSHLDFRMTTSSNREHTRHTTTFANRDRIQYYTMNDYSTVFPRQRAEDPSNGDDFVWEEQFALQTTFEVVVLSPYLEHTQVADVVRRIVLASLALAEPVDPS